jgi:hypothetical protein
MVYIALCFGFTLSFPMFPAVFCCFKRAVFMSVPQVRKEVADIEH